MTATGLEPTTTYRREFRTAPSWMLQQSASGLVRKQTLNHLAKMTK